MIIKSPYYQSPLSVYSMYIFGNSVIFWCVDNSEEGMFSLLESEVSETLDETVGLGFVFTFSNFFGLTHSVIQEDYELYEKLVEKTDGSHHEFMNRLNELESHHQEIDRIIGHTKKDKIEINIIGVYSCNGVVRARYKISDEEYREMNIEDIVLPNKIIPCTFVYFRDKEQGLFGWHEPGKCSPN